jgi:hypothetical protein
MTDPRDLQLTALEKAETALSLLRAIIKHDHSLITRQVNNGVKSAEASLFAAIEVMRREANAGAQ